MEETKQSALILLTVWNQLLISYFALRGLKQDISGVPMDTLQLIQFVLIAAISSINLGAIFAQKK